jgi:hypothetical protein
MTRDDWADALRDPLIEADETAPLPRATQTGRPLGLDAFVVRPLKGPNSFGGRCTRRKTPGLVETKARQRAWLGNIEFPEADWTSLVATKALKGPV